MPCAHTRRHDPKTGWDPCPVCHGITCRACGSIWAKISRAKSTLDRPPTCPFCGISSDYVGGSIVEAMNALREATGGAFDGVDPVVYVKELRGE